MQGGGGGHKEGAHGLLLQAAAATEKQRMIHQFTSLISAIEQLFRRSGQLISTVLIDVLQVSDTRVQYILPSQAREILEL